MNFFENSFFKRKQKKEEEKETDVFAEIEKMPGTKTLKMTKLENEEEINRWVGDKKE